MAQKEPKKSIHEITPKKPPMLRSDFWGEYVDWNTILGAWPSSIIDEDAERFTVKANSKLFKREAWQTVWLGSDCPGECRCPFTGAEMMVAETRALWPIYKYMVDARFRWLREWHKELVAQRAELEGYGPKWTPPWRRKDYSGNIKDYKG